jgi:cell division protein ZapA (FtsZ GTPase activity inhibitor)
VSETISTNITIGDRIYPLKVRAEDEAIVRKAEHLINQKFNEFQLRFAGQEKLDYLAMSALMNMVEVLKSLDEESSSSEILKGKLSEAIQLISDGLKKKLNGL